MPSTPADEETPLLHPRPRKSTPIPWRQYSIILFIQLAEPLTSQVIYPFAPQLIRDIGITHGNEAQVGYYLGLMQSIYYMTQAMTVIHWSRISDHVGRKPIILVGLFGLSLSMFCFGLSTTFWGLVVSRSLNGALNGNIGVMKGMMTEMTDSTNIAQMYAYMPVAWSVGGALGPLIGGSLSRPADRFPDVFGNNLFLKKYPYFLPCAVPAMFSALSWLVAFLFLRETVQSPVPASRLLCLRKSKRDSSCKDPRRSEEPQPPAVSESERPKTLRELLIPRVLITAINYALLALVDIAFRALQPLFFSTPIELGGLGLSPSSIGKVLSLYGILNGSLQILFFAKIHDRWGAKKTFVMGMSTALPVFAAFPLMSYLAKTQGLSPLVWTVAAVQTISSLGLNLAFGMSFIFISAASPNRASLGAMNGLCQMTVSVMRAIGPAVFNSLFSLSIEHHYIGGYLVYYVMLLLLGVAMMSSSLLPCKPWN
ncbi:member of major facilitator superfamily multidrug-resistance, DHA1 sub-family [Lyophyllum atratum]|nr:member of major facilitator superfamily multidrug-resistance, DHA1 sub-family [Lyophyllum atratum]